MSWQDIASNDPFYSYFKMHKTADRNIIIAYLLIPMRVNPIFYIIPDTLAREFVSSLIPSPHILPHKQKI